MPTGPVVAARAWQGLVLGGERSLLAVDGQELDGGLELGTGETSFGGMLAPARSMTTFPITGAQEGALRARGLRLIGVNQRRTAD